MGSPIRKFTDQSLFAAPHDLSQRITSFIACACQGIHQMPLRHLIVLIVNDHRFPAHSRARRCMGRGPSGPTAVRPCLRPLRVIGSASRPAAIKATQTNEREIIFERSFLVRHRKHRPGVQPEPTSCSGAILPAGRLNPTGERPASRDEPRRRAVRQHRSMAKGRYDPDEGDEPSSGALHRQNRACCECSAPE